VTFTGCVATETEPVCGRSTISVDAGPPRIELESPTPGDELSVDEAPTIPVVGRVIDSHGTVRAFVNGAPVDLDEDGRFMTEVRPVFGVNHIEVAATDGLQPVETIAAADVIWGATFHPADEGALSSVSFDDGISLRLGQRFFDDGIPLT